MYRDRIPINLVFEDEPQRVIMEKILKDNRQDIVVGERYLGRGFGYIKKRINNYNIAAERMPFFILTDLDSDVCAPSKIRLWLDRPIHNNLIFRIAVRQIESWLIADYKNFEKYFQIKPGNIPFDVDNIDNPKSELIKIIKKSKNRTIINDMVPRENSTAKIGPNYNNRINEFVKNYWDSELACNHSGSLYRAIQSIQNFSPAW